MRKVVFDTNYFIYASAIVSDFTEKAIEQLQRKDIEVCITLKNLSEIWAVLTKQNIPTNEINEMVQNIINNTKLLLPDKQTSKLFNDLCLKYKPRGNRVYDIEIVAIALTNNITEIASFNTKDFQEITEISLFN
jgi:predicted nucleic acid-binding protein